MISDQDDRFGNPALDRFDRVGGAGADLAGPADCEPDLGPWPVWHGRPEDRSPAVAVRFNQIGTLDADLRLPVKALPHQ